MLEVSGTERDSPTPGFRKQIAGLILDSNKTLDAVARETGVGERTLGLWVEEELQRRGGIPSSAQFMSTHDRLELKRLNAEVDRLRSQMELLTEMVSIVVGARVKNRG